MTTIVVAKSGRSVQSGLALLMGAALLACYGQTRTCLAQHIYWTDDDAEQDRIMRADVDGSNIQELFSSNMTLPVDLSVGQPVVTWCDYQGHYIARADQDGGGRITYQTNLNGPVDIDVYNANVYWADADDGTINRAELTPNAPIETLVETFLFSGVSGVTVGGPYVYYAQPPRSIRRYTDFPPYDVDILFSNLPDNVDQIFVLGNTLYWTVPGADLIQKGSTNGGSPQVVLGAAQGVDEPTGIWIDTEADKLYWTEFSPGKIKRANLNGTSVETVISLNNGINIRPRCVSIDPFARLKPPTPGSLRADPPIVCRDGSVTLSSGLRTYLIDWYRDDCGGTLPDNGAEFVGTGNPLMVSLDGLFENQVTFHARAREARTKLLSDECGSIIVDIADLPRDPFNVQANPPTICLGQSSTLSAQASGNARINWFTGSCGGSFVAQGNSIQVTPTVTTTYYARAIDPPSECESEGCGTVTVTVDSECQGDCTGRETLQGKCKSKGGGFQIKGVLKDGQPGTALTFRIDGVYLVPSTVNDRGKAKGKLCCLGIGRHAVDVPECPNVETVFVDCP